MIDIETRKIVDLIESRDYEDVKQWLKSFSNLEVVSRDGSIVYNKAIRDSHPSVIQISDRFHILKNLTDYLKAFLKRTFNNKIELGELDSQKLENILKVDQKYKFNTKWDLILKVKELRELNYTIKDICKLLGIGNKTAITYSKISLEEEEKYNKISNSKAKEYEVRKKKEYLIKQVKDLYGKRYNISSISKELSLDRRTVKKYLESDGTWEHGSKGVSQKSILDDYKDTIRNMYIDRYKATEIYLKIKEHGYTGECSLVRRFISTIRTEVINKETTIKLDYIEKKDLIKLLYNSIDKVKNISAEQLNKLYDKRSGVKYIFEILNEFKTILLSKNFNSLDDWINKCKEVNIRELNSFISGLERDKEAVNNAILYDYSNGLAEGKVNKIKMIKRVMYGRCKFETLKQKVLLLENNL